MVVTEIFRAVCTIISFTLFVVLLFYENRAIETKLLTLFFACLFMFNMGLAWETACTGIESALLARRFNSLFLFCILFIILLFSAKYTKIKVPRWIYIIIALWSFMSNAAMATALKHHWFIYNIRFEETGLYPHIEYKLGVMGHCYNVLSTFLPFMSLFIAICYYKKPSRTKLEKVRKQTLLRSMTIPIISLFFGKVLTNYHFDIILLGLMISGITLMYSAYHYQIFDVGENAKRQMLNTMSQALIILDESYGFIYANALAMKMFPECETAIEGSFMEELYHKLCEKEIIIGNRIYEAETTIVYDGLHLGGYSTCLFDVTERRKYEQELIKRKEQSDFANQSKSSFLASVSHEIRTPLNAIIGMSTLALRNTNEPKLAFQIKSIHHSAQGLLQIINSILDISKLESGKIELVQEEYYLESILYEVSNMMIMNLQSKKVKYSLEIQDFMPKGLIGDSYKIKQVLNNLLSNSMKYTKEGEIKLFVEYQKEQDYCILRFRVKDTGIGIHKEDIPKIFESYERVESNMNQGIIGTGLGLSIVHNYVDLMHGTIEVTSEYGKGTEFLVEIPQKIFDSEYITQLDLSAEKMENFFDEKYWEDTGGIKFIGASVLVVDDMEINLEVIKGLLEPYGMQIEVATSGDEAIRLIHEKEYDLVFMDHMMPVKDGVVTVKEIRATNGEKYQSLPIIMLTANAMVGMKEYFMQNGFQGFLPKPIDEQKLLKLLKKWLGQYQKYVPIEEIDYDVGLKNVDNHLQQYTKILGTYEKEMRDLRRKLPQIAQKNRNELRVKIHGIKGGSRSIGAMRLGDYAAKIEQNLKEGNEEHLEENLHTLDQMMDELLVSIHNFLARHKQQVEVTVDKDKIEINHDWWQQLYNLVSKFDSIQASRMIEEALPQGDKNVTQKLRKIQELLDILEYENCKSMILTCQKTVGRN